MFVSSVFEKLRESTSFETVSSEAHSLLVRDLSQRASETHKKEKSKHNGSLRLNREQNKLRVKNTGQKKRESAVEEKTTKTGLSKGQSHTDGQDEEAETVRGLMATEKRAEES